MSPIEVIVIYLAAVLFVVCVLVLAGVAIGYTIPRSSDAEFRAWMRKHTPPRKKQ